SSTGSRGRWGGGTGLTPSYHDAGRRGARSRDDKAIEGRAARRATASLAHPRYYPPGLSITAVSTPIAAVDASLDAPNVIGAPVFRRGVEGIAAAGFTRAGARIAIVREVAVDRVARRKHLRADLPPGVRALRRAKAAEASRARIGAGFEAVDPL